MNTRGPRKSKEQIEVATSRALDHRLKGLSYSEIAKETGTSKATAYRYVTDAIKIIQKEYTEKADLLVTLERQKLDRIELGAIEKARNGDLRAASVVLKIMERRSKLLGLDAPSQTEVKTTALEIDIKAPADLK